MTPQIFIGIDIGSAEHACEAIDESQQTLWRERIANTHDGCDLVLEHVHQWQQEGYEIWIIAEGVGGYASPLDLSLCEAGCRYLSIQPLQLQRYRELANWQPDKTDAKDARLLAEYGQWLVERGQHREVQILDEYFTTLRNLARATQQVVESKVSMQNQLVSTGRTYWPELFFTKNYFSKTDSAGFLALLSAYPSPQAIAQAGVGRIRRLLRQATKRDDPELAKRLVQDAKRVAERISVSPTQASFVQVMAQSLLRFNQTLADMNKQLETHVKQHPFGEWLLSVTGFGVRTAAPFLGEAGNLSRFKKESQLSRYAGNGANISQSGKSAGHHWNSHRYNHRLKRVIMLMAAARARYHPESKAFLQKRLQRGDSYWKAIKQLARHLIRFLWKSWGKVMNNLGNISSSNLEIDSFSP